MRRKIKKRLAVMAGVPLAVGSLAHLGEKLPGNMGTAMNEAISPNVPLVGAVVGVSALGIGIDALKNYPGIKLKKKRKR